MLYALCFIFMTLKKRGKGGEKRSDEESEKKRSKPVHLTPSRPKPQINSKGKEKK
jgi:hypothetical protein